MCLIVFAWKKHPKFDLILAANRDEFFRRPTEPVEFRGSDPQYLAGKDLRGGGTWLGVSKRGNFSAVTNYRDMRKIKWEASTRGRLPLNFLSGNTEPGEYMQHLRAERERYNGYNLIAGNQHEIWYYSNIEDKPRKLKPGIYGLSNHLLDTPWPKVTRAKRAMTQILHENDEPERKALFRLLADTAEASDDQLPDTGLDAALEKKLSPAFIRTDDYGTRSSHLLLIGTGGTVEFHERVYENGISTDKQFRFEVMDGD
jgi:uncharacterized protein with NRDE domain